mgnify:CR=1 FL=1
MDAMDRSIDPAVRRRRAIRRWLVPSTVVVAVLARVPAGFILRRMVVEVPFVVFALLLPFLAAGERVEVAGLSLSVEGLLADAAATALIVAGRSGWREIAQSLGLDQVLMIDGNGTVYLTRRMAERIELLDGIEREIVGFEGE